MKESKYHCQEDYKGYILSIREINIEIKDNNRKLNKQYHESEILIEGNKDVQFLIRMLSCSTLSRYQDFCEYLPLNDPGVKREIERTLA